MSSIAIAAAGRLRDDPDAAGSALSAALRADLVRRKPIRFESADRRDGSVPGLDGDAPVFSAARRAADLRHPLHVLLASHQAAIRRRRSQVAVSMAIPRQRWDDALARMDPLAFERLIADHFRREGYHVEHVGTGSSRRRYDGGIDLKLYRDEERIVVQCKRHTRSVVTHNPMHELIGVMRTARATGAILVNSGEFSDYARKMAVQEPRLRLIDGVELRAMLGDLLPIEPLPMANPPLSGPEDRKSAGTVTHGAPPRQSTGMDALAKIGLLLGLLLAFKFCASHQQVAKPAHPDPGTKPSQAIAQPTAEPMMELEPQPVPQQASPAPTDQRPYQTPDEAIKVLEESTPEV